MHEADYIPQWDSYTQMPMELASQGLTLQSSHLQGFPLQIPQVFGFVVIVDEDLGIEDEVPLVEGLVSVRLFVHIPSVHWLLQMYASEEMAFALSHVSAVLFSARPELA